MAQLGWADADPAGPNGAETVLSGLRRLPLGDVRLGFGSFASRVDLTRESARQRAVLWLPVGPIVPEVLLVHFHGHNLGWRHDLRKDRGGPRDLHRERIGAQLVACGRPAAAVLPQGGLGSEFSPGPFDGAAYLAALWAGGAPGIEVALGGAELPVVVAAHSGGGAVVASMLAEHAGARLPPNTQSIVLLDAINGPGELLAVQRWVERMIDATGARLAAAQSDEMRSELLASSVQLTVRTTTGSYRRRAKLLEQAIVRRLDARGGDLDPTLRAAWRSRFRFDPAPVGVDHDHLVGAADPLASALAVQ